jgi:hypothetical protein
LYKQDTAYRYQHDLHHRYFFEDLESCAPAAWVVVMLNEPTSDTALVIWQQSFILVGEAITSPAVMVGAVADARGTLTDAQTFSVTGQLHPHPH